MIDSFQASSLPSPIKLPERLSSVKPSKTYRHPMRPSARHIPPCQGKWVSCSLEFHTTPIFLNFLHQDTKNIPDPHRSMWSYSCQIIFNGIHVAIFPRHGNHTAPLFPTHSRASHSRSIFAETDSHSHRATVPCTQVPSCPPRNVIPHWLDIRKAHSNSSAPDSSSSTHNTISVRYTQASHE